jgi:hypothetical protein
LSNRLAIPSDFDAAFGLAHDTPFSIASNALSKRRMARFRDSRASRANGNSSAGLRPKRKPSSAVMRWRFVP